MKRTTIALTLILLVLLGVAAVGQAPRYLAPWLSKKIASSLPGTRVSIGALSGTWLNSVTLSQLSIEDAHSKLSFKKAELRYSLPGLFQKNIDLLSLQDGEAVYQGADEPMPKLSYGDPGKDGAVHLKKLSIKDLKLDIKTKDLSFTGTLSFTRDLDMDRFLEGQLVVPTLTAAGVQVKNLSTQLDYDQRGVLSAEKISFQKWSLGQVSILYEIRPDKVLLTLDSADWLGTLLQGAGEASFTKPFAYTFRADIKTLPLTEILTAYEWDKKLAITGQLGGYLEFSGEAQRLTGLKGRLRNLSDGTIVILDQAFLQRIADSAKQPIEIIKASFENYHYNTGDIAVSLDDQDIRLGIDLSGAAGKRNLEVHLHDLF